MLYVCGNVKEIPHIDSVRSIISSHAGITRIPPILGLEHICANSTKLAEIPRGLYMLKSLYIENTLVKDIPTFNFLKYLRVSNTKIRKLPKLARLSCNNTEIEEISDFSELKNLC